MKVERLKVLLFNSITMLEDEGFSKKKLLIELGMSEDEYSRIMDKEDCLVNNSMIEDNCSACGSMARLCEVAYITGRLEAEGQISVDGDLHELFRDVYIPILSEWNKGIENNIFDSEEEEGYISAYAQRRIIELYKI